MCRGVAPVTRIDVHGGPASSIRSLRQFRFASVVASDSDGDTAGVGVIGREGVIGGLHLMSPAKVPTECFIQLAGAGLLRSAASHMSPSELNETLGRHFGGTHEVQPVGDSFSADNAHPDSGAIGVAGGLHLMGPAKVPTRECFIQLAGAGAVERGKLRQAPQAESFQARIILRALPSGSFAMRHSLSKIM